jgi:rare lipoprotein A
VRPRKDLYARLARAGRLARSARSAPTPLALMKVAAFALPTLALASTASGAEGARRVLAWVVSPTGVHFAETSSNPSSRGTSLASTRSPSTHDATVVVGVSASRVDLNMLQDHTLRVRGALHPGLANRSVALEVRYRARWHKVAHSLSRPDGRFTLSYVPRDATTEAIRVASAGATRALGRLDVFRLVVASWYGGGGELACGGELTSSTLGVANKTLPCGTLVTLRYDGRSVRVPVIDRGPYVPGREFDLTEATKEALGFPGLGPVWSNR